MEDTWTAMKEDGISADLNTESRYNLRSRSQQRPTESKKMKEAEVGEETVEEKKSVEKEAEENETRKTSRRERNRDYCQSLLQRAQE